MIISNRLAGLIAAPAVAAALIGGAALTLASPASADVYSSSSYSDTDSYGVHPNNEIVVSPDTYAQPAPTYVPWGAWINGS
ncbi:hypothetical protein B1R94_15925 [Mycolicibacterium litorale]|nr:hypothetical protein B1R94_15925 [Mycolicibacterium litorale]